MNNGERIYLLREDNNLTITELAEKIGTTRQQLSRYEKDGGTLPCEVLAKAADYFDVTVDYLLGRTNCNIPPQDCQQNCIPLPSELNVGDVEIVMGVIRTLQNQRKKEPLNATN